MSLLKKENTRSFLFALLYGAVFYLLNLFFYQRDMAALLPDAKNLLKWDATFYYEIITKGYEFKATASNTAFYPLFPWIWGLSHLDAFWVSFLNLFLFSIGFAIFTSVYKLSDADKLVWLSVPSFYFVMIPYSEAIFILLVSILFWSIYKKRRSIVWIALILLALSRPVAMVLAPAFLITELIINDRSEWPRSLAKAFVNYILPLLLGTIFFICFQYYKTGVWFAFFEQEKHWGHEFAWPTLPFQSMYGHKLLWLNAIAMFTGFVSLLWLIRMGWRWLVSNKYENDRLLVLSFLYLTAIMFVTILFNPIWGAGTTNVYDIHRYAFVSPFFWVFLHRFIKEQTYKLADYIIVVILSTAFWLLFGSYGHIDFFLYYNTTTTFIVLYMLYSDKRLTWPALAIVAINVLVQIKMFQFFIAENIYPG